MSVTYAPGRFPVSSDSNLAVAFCRRTTGGDGSSSDPQWWDHAAGRPVNVFDPATCMKRLDVSAVDRQDQSFAVPLTVTDDPAAYAILYAVDDGGAKIGVVDVIPSCHLFWGTRGASAR